MIKVALTGGIGSGKSFISNIFAKMGVPVYEADGSAKKLYDYDEALKSELIEQFGCELYKSGKFDAGALARIIFSDRKELSKINSIVHPAVMRDFAAFVERNSDKPYAMMESAIIFDAGLASRFDKTITVSAPYDVRLRRIVERGCAEDEAKNRMKFQTTDNEREKLSDFVIINDEKLPLMPQILGVDKMLREIGASRYVT